MFDRWFPAALLFFAGPCPALAAQDPILERERASLLRGATWDFLGPLNVGGRVETLAVDPRDDDTIYVGAGCGGLFKTTNGGMSWSPIFDEHGVASIGEVALAPSDPDVVWLGTGETLMARSSYPGRGVFRSDDGGQSWRSCGLEDSHHIARVVVHPEDPDIVWVAALGHLFTPNEQRGVFKTTDGGASWRRVLFVDENTGAADLEIDPAQPDRLYATMWFHTRKAWGHEAHGASSGVHRSEDGGESWQLLGGIPPAPELGRVDLAVAPTQPGTLYALVDRAHRREDGSLRSRGTVQRSDDHGASWTEVQSRIPVGYDFCQIVVSPHDADHVLVPGQLLWRSTDGGRHFEELGGEVLHVLPHDATSLHLDHHTFWIDPDDPDHWWTGNDGGVYRTRDAGQHWLHHNNLPITEFYAVNLAEGSPARAYGGTQDNAAVYAEVQRGGPLMDRIWRQVYLDPWGGGDSYFTPSHPREPQIVYYEHQFGELRRKDLSDGSTVDIKPRAAEGEEPLRRNWRTPFLISPHDPEVLYYGAQRVLRSDDRGASWTSISPDLSGRPGPDRQGNVPFGTLTSLSESPLEKGLLWSGSDDGRVHVRDAVDGTWSDVTGPLPAVWVSRIEASVHHAGRAYVTQTGRREDDPRPFVFVTRDRGQSWRSIGDGLPNAAINGLIEHPRASDLLFLAHDRGVEVSLDRGRSWDPLPGGLPPVPVYDLALLSSGDDLVVATHGRGMFRQDCGPFSQLSRCRHDGSQAVLFRVRPVSTGAAAADPSLAVPTSTLDVAVLRYWISAEFARRDEEQEGGVQVRVRDVGGRTVRAWSWPRRAGFHRWEWDLLPQGVRPATGAFARAPERVPPGRYEVELECGSFRQTRELVLSDD